MTPRIPTTRSATSSPSPAQASRHRGIVSGLAKAWLPVVRSNANPSQTVQPTTSGNTQLSAATVDERPLAKAWRPAYFTATPGNTVPEILAAEAKTWASIALLTGVGCLGLTMPVIFDPNPATGIAAVGGVAGILGSYFCLRFLAQDSENAQSRSLCNVIDAWNDVLEYVNGIFTFTVKPNIAKKMEAILTASSSELPNYEALLLSLDSRDPVFLLGMKNLAVVALRSIGDSPESRVASEVFLKVAQRISYYYSLAFAVMETVASHYFKVPNPTKHHASRDLLAEKFRLPYTLKIACDLQRYHFSQLSRHSPRFATMLVHADPLNQSAEEDRRRQDIENALGARTDQRLKARDYKP